MIRNLLFPCLCVLMLLGCAEEPKPAAEDAATPELSAAEIDVLAAEQKVCAVSGEPLGSMGRPEPVSITDSRGSKHTVLICCEGCREELLAKSDEYLASLAEKQAAKTE